MKLTLTNITHTFDLLFHFLSLKSQSFISHREQLQLLLLERLCSSTGTNTTCEQRLKSKLTFIMVQTNNRHLSFISYLFGDGALITFTQSHTFTPGNCSVQLNCSTRAAGVRGLAQRQHSGGNEEGASRSQVYLFNLQAPAAPKSTSV